jgi:membrane protein YdbS with pleckstrin-like domain
MDNNNIDFATIWQQQKVSQPNSEELLGKLKKFKKSSVRKLIISNILLTATSGFILFVWYYYQPQFISTKLGIIVTILAMVIYLFTYNKQFTTFSKIDATQNISDYLQNLSSLKTKQKFMQSTMMSLYFSMLSLGISLYMYEYASRMTIFWGIFTYAITLAWIGFNWIYIRPIKVKKEQAKLDELINKFEAINSQLKEE